MADGRHDAMRSVGLRIALVTAAISGVAVAINGSGVRAFGDATAYTTGKNIVAAVILAVAAGVAGRRRAAPRPRMPLTPATVAGCAFVGLIGGGVAFALFFEGLARATSTDAAFLHKTLVLWVAVLAVPLLRERLSWLHAVAILLLLAGQVVLGGGLPNLGTGGGELMILAATLLWSGEVVVAKRLLPQIPALQLGVIRLGVGSVGLLVWLGVTGRADALLGMTASQWGWLLLTGVLLAGYVGTWFTALALAPAVDVTAVLVAAAVLTAIINVGAVAPVAVGAALIGAGVVAVTRARPAPQTA
jgi:drug/metabolite transporter (DMT)-like permease